MSENTTNTVPKRLLSIVDAAAYLGMHHTTLRRLIWDGHLDQVRINRRVFVELKDLDALIDRAKRNAMAGRS